MLETNETQPSGAMLLSWAGGSHLIHLLHRASQITEEKLLEMSPPESPTSRQLLVMEALSQVGRMSQTMIVQATGVDRSTIADIVKRLVRNGWVRRRRSRIDARVQIVELTESGSFASSAANEALKTAEAEVLAMISVEYRQQFLDALHEIREAMPERS